MDKESAISLLEKIGCTRIRIRGSQITSSCPFEENHYRGDRRPSFGAKVNDTGERSPYFCHGCHTSGTLEWLAIKNGYEDLVPDWKPKKLKNDKWINRPNTNRGLFDYLCDKKPVFFNDIYLEQFQCKLSKVLSRRGITIDTAKAWELRVDKENKRAVFVLRDIDGRIGLIKGRDTTGKSSIKYIAYVLDKVNHKLVIKVDYERESDFKRPMKSLFLYGEYYAKKVLDKEMKRRSNDLILVEGEVDVLKMWQWGWNAVGLIGSYPSKEQIEKIITLVPPDGRLVVMMDNDKAGRDCVSKIYEVLDNRISFIDAVLPVGKDPADMGSAEEVEKIIGDSNYFFDN